MSLNKNLNAIREVIDRDTNNDIELVKDKIIDLTQMAGLAAECQATAKKNFDQKRLMALKTLQDSGASTNIILKQSELECSEEGAVYEYAQRISAGISHSLDALRSVISLYKTELQNSLQA